MPALFRTSAVAALLLAATALPPAASATPSPPGDRVLVFSKTAAYRHDAIPDGITAIRELGAQHGFAVDATEDATAFTRANLARYDAVVFLSTTGDVLDAAQQSAFERYIRAGGGYAGVHAAADTEYDWAFYGGLVGAYFQTHPAIQQATVAVENRAHPATAHLGAEWQRTDEWYDYRSNPRERAHILATLDETSYEGGAMGEDHPIAWCQDTVAAAPSTPASATPRSPTPTPRSGSTSSAASTTPRARCGPTAARSAATGPCSTVRR